MDNQYGLDYKYFERWVERILNAGGFKNYRPHECAREFARMSRAANEAVLLEPEFTSALHERLRIAEAERDALKAEISELKTDLCAAHKRIEAERAGFESVLAVLEAARKQEPLVYLCWEKDGDLDYTKYNPIRSGTAIFNHRMKSENWEVMPVYASPVPAQQECTFHGADAQACMDYSKEVPCEFTWEQEAKLAFWHGWMLASGEKCDGHAEFISYIEKRKSELKGGENER